MKSLPRCIAPSLAKLAGSVPGCSSTKLWAIAIFGICPLLCTTMRSVSPGRASMVEVLNFRLSVATSSTVLGCAATDAAKRDGQEQGAATKRSGFMVGASSREVGPTGPGFPTSA